MLSLLFSLAFSLVSQSEERSFVSWMRSTNQIFTGDEYNLRLGIWISNRRLVQAHNSQGSTFKTAMNHLSHLTPTEYKSLLGFKPFSGRMAQKAGKKQLPTTDYLDWREKGAVNPVKNQGQCGSCWAFSTTQCCEGAEFLKYNVLYSFSEQSLVDCEKTDSGCNGGLPVNAFDFIINECGGKVMLEEYYPYLAIDGDCQYDDEHAAGHFKYYIAIAENDEDDLAAKCEQYGPISIGIDASNWSFQLYSRGIYDEPACSSVNLDHGVGLIGFGSENNVRYWLVRNSWGPAWGESGYIRMIRGSNQCGEASAANVIVSE